MSLATHANCPCCSCVEDGCCDNCTSCSACGSTNDIDIFISSTSQSGSASGSVTLQACVSSCGTCSKVDPNGCIRARVYNNSGSEVNVQFGVTVSGLSSGCSVSVRKDCGSATTMSNGVQNWFALNGVANGAYATATLDHYISGANCCDTSAMLESFTYTVSAVASLGFCCDSNPGTGDNPGCDPSLEVTGQGACADDADCEALFPIGSCQESLCGSCGSGSAWYVVTGYTSPACFFGTCGWDGLFSCCT